MISRLVELIKKHDHFFTERAKMLAALERSKQAKARILASGTIGDVEVSSLTAATRSRSQ